MIFDGLVCSVRQMEWGCRDRMVVGFTTTGAIIAYHQ
jgi:hypothetical protein